MRVTLNVVRIFLALALTLLALDHTVARDRAGIVPGLLYGSGPGSIVDQLVPDRKLTPDLAMGLSSSIGTLTATGCGGGVGKGASPTAANGPVGVSRYLELQDDPNCDEFWGSDKWRHVAVWFGGSLGLYLFFKSVLKTSKLVAYLLSATVMSVIGVAREISDANSEKNCFSEQDLFANTVGILAAGVVIAIF